MKKLTVFLKTKEDFFEKWNSWRSKKKMARNTIFVALIVLVLISWWTTSSLLNLLLAAEVEVIALSLLWGAINENINKGEPDKIMVPKDVLSDIFILTSVDKKNIVTVGAHQAVQIFEKHLVSEIYFNIKKIGSDLFSSEGWKGVRFDSTRFMPNEKIILGETVNGIDNGGKTVFAQEIIGKYSARISLGGTTEAREGVEEFIEGCAKITKPQSRSTGWFTKNWKTMLAYGGAFIIILGLIPSLYHEVPIEGPGGMILGSKYAAVEIKDLFKFLLGGAAFAFFVLSYESLPPK